MTTVTLFLSSDGKETLTRVQSGREKFYMDAQRIAVSPVPRKRDLEVQRMRARHVANVIGGKFIDETEVASK